MSKTYLKLCRLPRGHPPHPPTLNIQAQIPKMCSKIPNTPSKILHKFAITFIVCPRAILPTHSQIHKPKYQKCVPKYKIRHLKCHTNCLKLGYLPYPSSNTPSQIPIAQTLISNKPLKIPNPPSKIPCTPSQIGRGAH